MRRTPLGGYGKRTEMKEDIKGRSIFYINIALAIALVVILIIMLKPLFLASKTGNVGGIQPKNLAAIPQQPAEPVYDIDKIKKDMGQPEQTEREFSDFKEMYANCNKANVGGNMVEAWSKVKPEDKARLSEGFDKQIASAHEALKANPEDKRAKHLLYISETLKKMAADGFNYKFKNKK